MKVDETLHIELERLHKECEDLIRELKEIYQSHLQNHSYEYTIKDSDGNTKIIDLLELLENISTQLDLHLKLDDTQIKSVNFYKLFQSQFEMGSYQKGVKYYIQEGYENDSIQINDNNILEKEFIINNCMNSMSLVPLNLASNAKKYMPKDTEVKVELLKTTRRNIITITNLAPKNEEDNLEKLTEEGYRGCNSSEMAGMGLGLSLIKLIVEIHKPLLDATIDIDQRESNVSVYDKVYSWFSVTITYLRNATKKDVSLSQHDFADRLPLIIAHNMVDIIANMFVVADKLPKLWFKDRYDSLKNSYKKRIEKFKLSIERMQECIKICLYVRNQYSTKYLKGNECNINVGNFFIEEMTQLLNHKYEIPNSLPTISDLRDCHNREKLICTCSAVYPIIYGLCDLLLSNVTDGTDLGIEIDENEITICSSSMSFVSDFYGYERLKDAEEENMSYIRTHMFIDVLKECNINMQITNKKIIITYIIKNENF